MEPSLETSTPRKKKSEQTMNRIMETSLTIIKEYGFENLTVKNICNATGISNGTFFHFFNSKNDLLRYYFMTELESLMFRSRNFTQTDFFYENLIRFYLCYCRHCQNLGVAFIKYYYAITDRTPISTVYNINFNFFKATEEILYHARRMGYLVEEADITQIARDLRTISNGVVYEWCISNEEIDIQAYMKRMLSLYLKSVINPKYLRIFEARSYLHLQS